MTEKKPLQSPLTLIMKLKISTPDEIKAFEDLLKMAHVKLIPVFDAIKVVHFARFVILDGKYGKELGIFTEYDGKLETYVNDFIALSHTFLDNILEVVEGAPTRPIINNKVEFIEWAKKHDLGAVTFYSAYPNKQVIDIID